MKYRPRVLCIYTSGKLGPLLFVLGGVYGNEPSAVLALRRVFKALEDVRPEISGTLVGVCGNHAALGELSLMRFFETLLPQLSY